MPDPISKAVRLLTQAEKTARKLQKELEQAEQLRLPVYWSLNPQLLPEVRQVCAALQEHQQELAQYREKC